MCLVLVYILFWNVQYLDKFLKDTFFDARNTYDFLDEIYFALHNDSTLILKMGNEKNFCDSRSNLANSI